MLCILLNLWMLSRATLTKVIGNGARPGLNKGRHGLGDVVSQHVRTPPDVPLEVANSITLVAHLKLRGTILNSGQVTEGVPDSGGPVWAL